MTSPSSLNGMATTGSIQLVRPLHVWQTSTLKELNQGARNLPITQDSVRILKLMLMTQDVYLTKLMFLKSLRTSTLWQEITFQSGLMRQKSICVL